VGLGFEGNGWESGVTGAQSVCRCTAFNGGCVEGNDREVEVSLFVSQRYVWHHQLRNTSMSRGFI
jgi:hypothetical protein